MCGRQKKIFLSHSVPLQQSNLFLYLTLDMESWLLVATYCSTVTVSSTRGMGSSSVPAKRPCLWTPYVFNCAMEMSSDQFAIEKLF